MDRRRGQYGRTLSSPPPWSERGGRRATSASKRRGRDCLREKGQARALSLGIRERFRGREGSRSPSPRPRILRGGEHRCGREVTRERRRGREGARSPSPTARLWRGREDHRHRATSCSCVSDRRRQRARSPTMRRGSRHHRAASVSTFGVHERRRDETQGPRAPYTRTERGRQRHREKDGPRARFPIASQGREEHGFGTGRVRASFHDDKRPRRTDRGHMRPHSVPHDSHRGLDNHAQPEAPRSASPRSGSAPSASSRGHKRHRELGVLKPGGHNEQLDEKEAKCIMRLSEDILGEVIHRLNPVDLSNFVCANRAILHLANKDVMMRPYVSPFLGAMFLHRNSHSLATVMERNLQRGVKSSVRHFRGFLKQIGQAVKIIDCRYGLVVLKFGFLRDKFGICSPFRAGSWIELPQCDYETGKVMAGAVTCESKSEINFSVLCLENSSDGYHFPLILKVFNSGTKQWKTMSQSLYFREGNVFCHMESIHQVSFIFSAERELKLRKWILAMSR